MNVTTWIRRAARWLAVGVGLGSASYAMYAGVAWYRYGSPKHPARGEESDSLLDEFIPEYEVAERHYVRVGAPAEMTLSVAADMDIRQSMIVDATSAPGS